MGKHIQAYFRTENDAEDARIRMQAYGISNLEVSRMPMDNDGVLPVVPVVALGTMSTSGTTAAGSIGGVAAGAPGIGNGMMDTDTAEAAFERRSLGGDNVNEGDRHRDGFPGPWADWEARESRYVLTGEVSSDSYHEALEVIRSHDGRLAKLDE